MPELLRGMFAFALWDARAGDAAAGARSLRRKAALLRRAAGRLRVRLRARRACSPTSGRPPRSRCRRSTPTWRCSTCPAPTRSTRALKKLPAGHTLEIRCGERPVVRRYYRPSFAPTLADLDEREAAAPRARRRSRRRCRTGSCRTCRSGAFLSGGIDSSIVVACMARATGSPVKTFSVGFSEGGREDNELPLRAPGRRALPHRSPRADRRARHDRAAAQRSCATTASRSPTRSAVPTCYLCELTRRHVTVALSGDAGDEAFGGYRRYVWAHVADLLLRLPASAPAPGGRARSGQCRAGRRAGCASTARASATDEATRYLRFVCHFSAGEKARHLHARAARAVRARRHGRGLRGAGSPTARATDVVEPPAGSRLRHLSARRHPGQGRHRQHEPRPRGARAVLRSRRRRAGRRAAGSLQAAAGEGQVHPQAGVRRSGPAAIIERRKKGFALPTGRWLAGRLHGFARELLLSSAARQRGPVRAGRGRVDCSIATAPARTTASGSGTSWCSRPGFESWSTVGLRSCGRPPRARPRLAAPNPCRRLGRPPCRRLERRDRPARTLLA